MIALVIFVVLMLLWLVTLLPAGARIGAYSGWVPFLAVLDLGWVVLGHAG